MGLQPINDGWFSLYFTDLHLISRVFCRACAEFGCLPSAHCNRCRQLFAPSFQQQTYTSLIATCSTPILYLLYSGRELTSFLHPPFPSLNNVPLIHPPCIFRRQAQGSFFQDFTTFSP